jgi:hypothetical protein
MLPLSLSLSLSLSLYLYIYILPLNATEDPRLDPGTEKGHLWKNWGNQNKDCSLVNSTGPASAKILVLINAS